MRITSKSHFVDTTVYNFSSAKVTDFQDLIRIIEKANMRMIIQVMFADKDISKVEKYQSLHIQMFSFVV